MLRSGFANSECRDDVSFSNPGGQTVIQWPKFGGATPWARAIKNAKKPPGEKRRTLKNKNTFGPRGTFLIL